MRAYQLIAQGRLVIKAMESVVSAGLNEAGLPKLALCRADAPACDVRLGGDGSARMHDARVNARWSDGIQQSRSVFAWPRGSFAVGKSTWRATSLVPGPPLHLRPQRGLANYHVLWEAEWTRIVPRDPYLLRRIGWSDLWLVVAMWNLTEVERAALSTRIGN
jgi:hypothetical protein